MRGFVLAAVLVASGISTTWADSRFTARDSEVYDTQTKLTWARCSVGQQWGNGHCTGTIGTFSFDDAKKLAADGWRLPTKDELVTLIDSSQKAFPTIDAGAFPDMDAGHPWYWSGTPNGRTIAWYVDFSDGYTSGFIDQSNKFAIRLVRATP